MRTIGPGNEYPELIYAGICTNSVKNDNFNFVWNKFDYSGIISQRIPAK